MVLSSFFKPTYDKPFMRQAGNPLVDYFNANGKRIERSHFENASFGGSN